MFFEILVACAISVCVVVVDGKMFSGPKMVSSKREAFVHDSKEECLKGVFQSMLVAKGMLQPLAQGYEVHKMECVKHEKERKHL